MVLEPTMKAALFTAIKAVKEDHNYIKESTLTNQMDSSLYSKNLYPLSNIVN